MLRLAHSMGLGKYGRRVVDTGWKRETRFRTSTIRYESFGFRCEFEPSVL